MLALMERAIFLHVENALWKLESENGADSFICWIICYE